MGDVYQHLVFFEGRSLDGAQRRKIRLYFTNHRKSGGGECGAPRLETDNIYSIAFKDKKDQQNVLQRPKHEVAGCSLVLTDTVESLCTFSTTTSSSSQECTQSSKSVPVSNPPSRSESEHLPATLPLKAEVLLLSCCSHQTTDGKIVGTHSQVNSDNEDRDSCLSEIQTSTYQLGEAKLHLLWGEINHIVTQELPGVKVSHGDSGQLVLEGSQEKIRMVVDLVSKMENLVLERRVSDMGPHLVTFLRKAYGGPGVLAGVLGLGDEVVIELRDTELHVFSLSTDELDKAEKSVQCKFREVKLDVLNGSALPELREKLKSKTNKMNQEQCRAQAVFISDRTVCLLGHSKEVEELSETVAQYILDESNMQRTFHVPDEENTIVASYSLSDGLQVLVCQGDITKVEADALVNAANEDLDHCGGVAAALSKAGGPEVQKESTALVKQTGKVRTGEVVVTTGGNLKCKKLLHAVGPKGRNAGGRERSLLEKTVTSALNLAEMMEFRSIAIPCISSGASALPVTVCSEAIVTAVEEFGGRGGRSLSTIILIDNREEVMRALHDACERILPRTSGRNWMPSDEGIQDGAAAQHTARGATAGAAEDGVHVEILQGTIETQQVDAIVSPMVGHDPLSTRIGNTLFTTVGPELTARFRKETLEETFPGDSVLVGDLPGQPFNAVFFLNLAAWDEDQDGTAAEVLGLAVNTTLMSCEQRGFRSVALPLLGTGAALSFPYSVVARVLLEGIHSFRQSRVSRTSFLVRIIIHPNEKESAEVFKSVQEAFMKDVHEPDLRSTTKRIVLLGKTGTGKSSLANTIFGEDLFTVNHSPNSGTKECQSETRVVNERSITLIDTPGLFDTGRAEKEVDREIVSCITECAPGPHAFLILLKVEKFTEQEKAVISKICGCFSQEALKYAIVVFTHGEQLDEGMRIEDFVRQNESLNDLVEKCGNRCHVFDNKNWRNQPRGSYRSNELHVEELLQTIDKLVREHSEGYYTNEMLQKVEEELLKEEELIRTSSANMSAEEIRKEAKRKVSQRFLKRLTGTATGVVMGAFLGMTEMVKLFMTAVKSPLDVMKSLPGVGKAVAGVAAGEVITSVGIACVVGAGVVGGVMGGIAGCDAADEAETCMEAIDYAVKAVRDQSNKALNSMKR